jgi:phage terminase small subunit
MGGKGSGGSNRKSIDEHIRSGTYRPCKHGVVINRKPPSFNVQQKHNVQQKSVSKTLPVKAAKQVCNASFPVPPMWFDEHEKEAWNITCDLLQKKGTLHLVAPAAIQGFCTVYSNYIRARKETADGFSYKYIDDKTLSTKLKVKPEVAIAKDALNQMRFYLDSLGLLPKTSVVIAPPDDARSEMEKFLDQADKKTNVE